MRSRIFADLRSPMWGRSVLASWSTASRSPVRHVHTRLRFGRWWVMTVPTPVSECTRRTTSSSVMDTFMYAPPDDLIQKQPSPSRSPASHATSIWFIPTAYHIYGESFRGE